MMIKVEKADQWYQTRLIGLDYAVEGTELIPKYSDDADYWNDIPEGNTIYSSIDEHNEHCDGDSCTIVDKIVFACGYTIDVE